MSKGLEQIPGVVTYGPKHGRRIALLCFNVDGLRPLELALELEKSARIMVRAGHHCALPLIKVLQTRLARFELLLTSIIQRRKLKD